MITKTAIIKKLENGKYRLYSRKKDKNGKRHNLGTFPSLSKAKEHEKAIQYFKHHADDGKNDDKSTKVVSKLSNIANFLENAGFIDAADKVYCAMDAVDGSFDDTKEDYLVDSIVSNTPDVQNALPGSMDYMMTGEIAGGMQGTLNAPEAEKIAALANKLDEHGLYDEANELDDILKQLMSDKDAEIIDNLEKIQDKSRKTKVNTDEKDKAGVEVLVDSNGHVETDFGQHSGFSGLSDAYFFRGPGSIESNI